MDAVTIQLLELTDRLKNAFLFENPSQYFIVHCHYSPFFLAQRAYSADRQEVQLIDGPLQLCVGQFTQA
jgi:hypothetical protein